MGYALFILGAARRRLRGRVVPIVQTGVAAVVSWYLAAALVADPRPSFAAIAAVISVGASYGQRSERAVQLVGGVVIGITAADALSHVVGVGGPQMGVMVVLAMSAAVLAGGGELLVVEAAVSAILIVALGHDAEDSFSPNRIIEAVIGGAAALGVSSLFSPPDPGLGVARAAQALFAQLGRTLERIMAALADRDAELALAALVDARDMDRLVRHVHEALEVSRETVRLSPPRRGAREQLDRYARSAGQVDFLVRNARMLARDALRAARSADVPAEIPVALRRLGDAVWELGAAFDDLRRSAAGAGAGDGGGQARHGAARARRRARRNGAGRPGALHGRRRRAHCRPRGRRGPRVPRDADRRAARAGPVGARSPEAVTVRAEPSVPRSGGSEPRLPCRRP